jgi:hypothetical protein
VHAYSTPCSHHRQLAGQPAGLPKGVPRGRGHAWRGHAALAAQLVAGLSPAKPTCPWTG